MKKLLFLILTTFLFFSFSQKARAFTLEAQSDKANSSQTFVILANPPRESTAVQVRLEVEGGTVTSFTAGDNDLLSIGTCDEENRKYTPSSICVDIATSVGNIERADILGVFTVEKSNEFTQLRISKTGDNAYIGPKGIVAVDTGIIFTLYGTDLVKDTHERSSSSGVVFMLLMITFLMGVVIGTTFTTLGHVLQANRSVVTKKK